MTRLIECLALDQVDRQIVFYDQGVGTTSRKGKVDELLGKLGNPQAFHMLEAPLGRWTPAATIGKVRGQLTGYGLKENLREMYTALATYFRPGDRLYLFGFSRGAFTVRALAGLLHRCHLAPLDAVDKAERFERSWKLFIRMFPSPVELEQLKELREQNRPCPIYLLGLWDTVKSYGGLKPVILPHLRHNPDVTHVRHALALDERRAWFKATTWGLLDSDAKGAGTRLDPQDEDAFKRQSVSEVWFAGAHSDIGCGDIALRWMLGEIENLKDPLIFRAFGKARLESGINSPVVHDSWNRLWGWVEQIPRLEIDNSGRYPEMVPHRGSDGRREPEDSARAGTVWVHESVGAGRRSEIRRPVQEVRTKSTPANSAG